MTVGDRERPAEDNNPDHVETDEDGIATQGQALINAILENAPIGDVQKLLDEDPPLWYQDEDGWSALHAAASVEDMELIKVLLQHGALWNSGKCLFSPAARLGRTTNMAAVDSGGNTAGDIALSLNDEESYRVIRDAGIRSGVCVWMFICGATDFLTLPGIGRTYLAAASLSWCRGRWSCAQRSG
jgi:hypothetical protein